MAGAMSLVLYIAVLIVSVTSVLLGLDWLATPPPSSIRHPEQMARTTAPINTAVRSPVRNAAVSSAPVAKPASPPTDSKPAASAAAAPATSTPPAAAETSAKPDAAAVPAEAAADAAKPAALPSETIADLTSRQAAPQASAAPGPRCDVQACASAYQSFRASDCTWQPYGGPRRFCDKGTPPAAAPSDARAQAGAPACNVQACARAYYSFDASDCTWQPYEGPRQLCEK